MENPMGDDPIARAGHNARLPNAKPQLSISSTSGQNQGANLLWAVKRQTSLTVPQSEFRRGQDG